MRNEESLSRWSYNGFSERAKRGLLTVIHAVVCVSGLSCILYVASWWLTPPLFGEQSYVFGTSGVIGRAMIGLLELGAMPFLMMGVICVATFYVYRKLVRSWYAKKPSLISRIINVSTMVVLLHVIILLAYVLCFGVVWPGVD